MTGDDGFGPDDRVLAAEYVLGLLTPDEAEALEARAMRDPALRDELALWQGYLTAMTAPIAETAPPARVKRRIETALFGAPQKGAAGAASAGTGWMSRLMGRRALGAMSLVAAAGIAALVIMTPQTRGPQAPLDPGYAAELVSENTQYLFSAAWSPDQQAVAVTRLEGTPRPDRAEELWLIAQDAAPVSLGLLDPSGQSVITVPDQLAALMTSAVLAVSDEPPGGAPGAAPTGEVLAAGPVQEL
jgi:anti-sigma-K factor RskA